MSEFNSNITKKFEVFKKVLSKYIDNIDIDGIKFELTKHTTPKRIQGFELDVPLIKILNPKSIPFSYNSLSDLLSIELSIVNQFTKTFPSHSYLERSFDFYDFDNNDYVIPNKIENNLLNSTGCKMNYFLQKWPSLASFWSLKTGIQNKKL